MPSVRPGNRPYTLHVTRVGESSLHEVAAKNYGDPNLWQQVHEANPGLDPYAVEPGTPVVVPSQPGGLPNPGGQMQSPGNFPDLSEAP